MITNFEELTCDLTEEELMLVPLIISGLKTKTKETAITGDEIVAKINILKNKKVLSPVKLRKIINFIRSRSMLPVIATSKGYFCSVDPNELNKQYQSLMERIKAMQSAADGILKIKQSL
mgnify:CR=1 FL=1